jgi:hypothetical protein
MSSQSINKLIFQKFLLFYWVCTAKTLILDRFHLRIIFCVAFLQYFSLNLSLKKRQKLISELSLALKPLSRSF